TRWPRDWSSDVCSSDLSHLLTEAGGCTSAVLNEGVCRAPGFAFRSLREAGMFVLWATEHVDDFRQVAEATTRFGKLDDMRITVRSEERRVGKEDRGRWW